MNELLAGPAANIAFGESIKGLLTLVAISTLRVYAVFMVFPPTQDTVLTGPVRNGFCLVIGMYIAWGQPLYPFEHMSAFALAVIIVKEVVIGLVIGISAAMAFWVVEGVGALLDNMSGFNNVQMTNPLSGQQSTPLANLLGQLASSLFWMLGGALALIGVLFQSFHWWPLAKVTLSWTNVLEDFAAIHLQTYMAQAVTIAAPVLLVLLLIELGFGVIAKTADKLEPNMMSQPLKGAVATVMLSLLVVLYFHEAQPALALKNLAATIQFWINNASTPR
jgi:type III secretion protein T